MSSSVSFASNGLFSCSSIQPSPWHELSHLSLHEGIASAPLFETTLKRRTSTRLQERAKSMQSAGSTRSINGVSIRCRDIPSTSYHHLSDQLPQRKRFCTATKALDSSALEVASSTERRSSSKGASSSESDSASADVIGVVIVDHGSRRAESNKLLDAFVTLYKAHTGRNIVEAAHMEIARPSIADAFDKVVERGANLVVVSPYFLSPGRHWFQDIPELAAEASEKHPGVRYLVTAPIGLHPLMADIIEGRIQHCLQHAAGKVDECDVCKGSGRCRIVNT